MQPGLVARTCVRPRCFIDGQTVVDVLPIVERRVGRIDAEGFDAIDQVQHAFDFWPAGEPQQDLAAGSNVGHGRTTLVWRDGSQNVDARDEGAEVVRGPTHERKDTARRKREYAPPLVEDFLFNSMAKADPVLDALLKPQKLDMGEVAH